MLDYVANTPAYQQAWGLNCGLSDPIRVSSHCEVTLVMQTTHKPRRCCPCSCLIDCASHAHKPVPVCFQSIDPLSGAQVISTFGAGKMFYVAKLHPDEDKQNMLFAGCGDKKIYQFDVDSGDSVQVRKACRLCTSTSTTPAAFWSILTHFLH